MQHILQFIVLTLFYHAEAVEPEGLIAHQSGHNIVLDGLAVFVYIHAKKVLLLQAQQLLATLRVGAHPAYLLFLLGKKGKIVAQ